MRRATIDPRLIAMFPDIQEEVHRLNEVYVTAVSRQGQTRYGRKSSGGVLSGRDPAVLPGCAE